MNYIEFYYNRDKYKGEDSSDFLSHYGILGQKWGQRRWQNADETFNAEGKERYFGTKTKIGSNNDETKKQEKINKKVNRTVKYQLKEIERYNKSPFYKKNPITISEDALKQYYQAYYELPWYKRTNKNINDAYLAKFNKDMDNNTAKNIKRINDIETQENLRLHMQQVNQMNEIHRINNEINQINQMNQLNQLNQLNQMNQMNMMTMPGFMGQPDSKIGSTNNKTNKLLNSEEYKDLARNVGVDFLDSNDLASDNIKKDYKAVKNNINPFIVAMDDFAHGHDESAINYLNRFVKDKKEREILTKLCKKYGEKEKIVIEENNKKTEELINNIKTNKKLKNNDMNENEYNKILKDTINNINLKGEDYKNVADIGLYKLNQMGNGSGDPGDDGSRTWFMYEDQTIGLPEITYLYYNGYSKNYIKQYVKNVNNKLNNMSYDEQDEYYENHPGTWQIQYADEYGYADDWINNLFKNSK